MSRELSYGEAINEATLQAMEKDAGVFVIGEGVDDATGIFNTTRQAFLKFGADRVMDTPLSENAITGAALGAAVMGMRPLVVFARDDFMLLAMDQIVNHAAKWSYTYGGKMIAPVVYRSVIGRGWGQGPQHSQSLQSLFAHIPGLKVVMPVTAYDAKGLLLASLEEKCPVIFMEHRWLHKEKSEVPEEYYKVPIGEARVAREGKDVTVVAVSQMVLEALKAAQALEKNNVSLEVIDLRTLRPWDKKTVLESVKKTGRLIVADTGWSACGIAGEIVATAAQEALDSLVAPPRRIGLAESPAPSSYKLEEYYYPDANDIISAVSQMLKNSPQEKIEKDTGKNFNGSF